MVTGSVTGCVSMRITRFVHESSKVFNIARSPPASLLFKGQGTKHTTVKWPFLVSLVCHRRFGNVMNAFRPAKTNRKVRTLQGIPMLQINVFGMCYLLYSNGIWKFQYISVTQLIHFPGHTFIAVRDGDFLFTYCLWFEDSSGNPVVLHCPLPVLYGSPPPGILSTSFYK